MCPTTEQTKTLNLPNPAKILSLINAIGVALDEMCMHNRGTARRLVLKDKIMELAAEVATTAYRHDAEETNEEK